jgi:hypothetical protein
VEERQQVADQIARLCGSLRLNPATGGFAVDERREIRAADARRICPAP